MSSRTASGASKSKAEDLGGFEELSLALAQATMQQAIRSSAVKGMACVLRYACRAD